jgi:hypothetical protein
VVLLNSPCWETHKNAMKENSQTFFFSGYLPKTSTYQPHLVAICQINAAFKKVLQRAPRSFVLFNSIKNH